jgi:hypothetical protein
MNENKIDDRTGIHAAFAATAKQSDKDDAFVKEVERVQAKLKLNE